MDINIDISLEKLDSLISGFDKVIDELGGSLGFGTLGDIELTIQDELEGEYKSALVTAVYDIKLSYSESLSNVIAMRSLLADYKYYLQSGENNTLINTENKVKYDSGLFYKEIKELENVIVTEGTVKKVLQNDDSFERWKEGYAKSLDDGLIGTYTVDDEGNQIKDNFLNKHSHAEELFKANSVVFESLNSALTEGFVLTNSITDKLEVESGLISGELSNISDIWNGFDLNRCDARNFLEAAFIEQNLNKMEESEIELRNKIFKDLVQSMSPEEINLLAKTIKAFEDKLNKVAEKFPDTLLYDLFNMIGGPILKDKDIEEKLFSIIAPWVNPSLGFEYNEEDDYYYTNDTSIQSRLGFADEFDNLGALIGMDLDTEVIIFDSGEYDYRLQLWKGEYGFGNAFGAEVGLYVRPIQGNSDKEYNENTFYEALPEGHQITIRNEVIDSNGNVLIDNNSADYEDDHFWNLSIRTTEMPDAKDKLTTKTHLTIEDDQIKADLVDALNQDDNITSIGVVGDEVIFTWE